MYYELTDHFVVKSDAQQTWDFFSTAANLAAITPPWLGFIVRPPGPIQIQQDSVLDYTVRWLGIPIHWRTIIIDWSPPRAFIDLQIKGPYVLWHHQHVFSPAADGTDCVDRVIYKLPLGWIGQPVHHWIVRGQLLEIFAYRRRVIGERLGWVRAVQDGPAIRRL